MAIPTPDKRGLEDVTHPMRIETNGQATCTVMAQSKSGAVGCPLRSVTTQLVRASDCESWLFGSKPRGGAQQKSPARCGAFSFLT